MPIQRATRDKTPARKEPATQPKTVELWCDKCHSKRTEGIFQAWQTCPFKDCTGTLRATPPPGPPPAPKFIKGEMALLKAMEAGDE